MAKIGARVGSSLDILTDGRGFSVGDTHDDQRGKRYIFVQASSAIAQFDAVWVKSDHEAIPVTLAIAQTSGRFAVAPVAIAQDEYGWVQCQGACTVSVLASCAANAQLFTSGTAGALDDATLSHSQVAVNGIVLQSAEAASNAAAYMDNVVIQTRITA